jgi:hypothetical protein
VREGLQWPSAWTRDGFILFTDVPLDEDRNIWAVKADGSEPPVPYLDTPFIEKSADVSPDGRWIAYDSNAPERLIAVRLDLRDGPRVMGYSTVLETSYASADHPNYDVHPDGKHFAVVLGRARPQRIIVAINPITLAAQRR